MTTTERAVRKASRERLLRDFARAALWIGAERAWIGDSKASENTLLWAAQATSRTRYACLMTAFGQ